MNAMHRFNTLTYCQDLERAGMSRQLAEVQALALYAALDHSVHVFATKADLAQGLAALDKEIRITKSELSAAVITLERKIHETKNDLSGAVTTLKKKILESEARLEKEIHRSIAPIEKNMASLDSDVKIVKWCFGIMIPILLTLMIPVMQGLYKQFVLGQG
jgi:hypothetical protein